MIIYMATNNINGKVYIGQTIGTLEQRKTQHISKGNNNGNYYFHNALRKYGTDNFYWILLNECDNIDTLNQLEQYYISCYNSMNVGYNLTSGGLNYIVSDKTKQRMSKNSPDRSGKNNPMYGIRCYGEDNPMYGKHHSDEVNEKNRKAHLDKTVSDKTRKKLSIAGSGENNSNYGKYGKDSSNYGKHHTEETIGKMRQMRLGKNNPMYDKHHTAGTKGKMRIAQLKRWAKVRDEKDAKN